MPDSLSGSVYDFPKYYDLIFGSDWKAEYDFLLDCFERYLPKRPQRLFEPACGTGRLLVKLAQCGFEVAGIDLNAKAIEYCNRRLQKHGYSPAARLADMADFRELTKYDAAFNMINSFRHLPDEAAAEGHLKCMAGVLRKGGIYLLGFHLTPTGNQVCDEESWSARRGHLAVTSRLWSIAIDRRRREERVGMTYDIYTPTEHQRIEDEMIFRTYSHRQFAALLERVGAFEVLATHDFGYDIDDAINVDHRTEDVVFVLQKR